MAKKARPTIRVNYNADEISVQVLGKGGKAHAPASAKRTVARRDRDSLVTAMQEAMDESGLAVLRTGATRGE